MREALWFDLTPPETSDELSLAEWRVAGLAHIPLLLGAMHLAVIITFAVMFVSGGTGASLDNPLIPSVLLLMLDAGTAALLYTRDRWNLAPHAVTRALCVYLMLGGILWAWFGNAVADDVFSTPLPAATIAMSAGIAMGAIVTVNSPPLAMVNAFISAGTVVLLATSGLVIGGVDLLSLVLLVYSIAGARSFIATGRKRLRLEVQARKAQHFVDEFENSGRGWFWETNSLGTLSYVSRTARQRLQL